MLAFRRYQLAGNILKPALRLCFRSASAVMQILIEWQMAGDERFVPGDALIAHGQSPVRIRSTSCFTVGVKLFE